MPVIEVHMWAGRSTERKKKIIKGITDVFVSDGADPASVTVILHDVNKSDWGMAGKPADEA
jgi:4-oxalocrotonate tautomerase